MRQPNKPSHWLLLVAASDLNPVKKKHPSCCLLLFLFANFFGDKLKLKLAPKQIHGKLKASLFFRRCTYMHCIHVHNVMQTIQIFRRKSKKEKCLKNIKPLRFLTHPLNLWTASYPQTMGLF